jgi:hypothetical protein
MQFLCILYHIFISLCQNFTDLKKELIRHGQTYATEALTYRKKIAELAFGFIRDGSVVSSVHLISIFFLLFFFSIKIHLTRFSHILIHELWCKLSSLHTSGNAYQVWPYHSGRNIFIFSHNLKFLSQKHALADWGMWLWLFFRPNLNLLSKSQD